MTNKISLPNGCSMSTPSVSPKDWKNGKHFLTEQEWRIQYYFYDPEKPKGKLIVRKTMNAYKEIKEQRAATELIIQDEILQNKRGFNHFLKRLIIDHTLIDNELHPDLPFIEAFRLALEELNCTIKHKKEIGWAIDRLEKKAIRLRFYDILISQLKRSELKRMLEACNFPDYYFNKVRGYFSTLFGELLEYECCDTNLTRDIRKRKVVVKKREILSPEHHKLVMDHLDENHYVFWRYARIFLFSGSRSTELFALQDKDVDIENKLKLPLRKAPSIRK